MTSALFSTLMADPQSEHWTQADLQKLSMVELQGLAKLFGAPTSGSKAELADRLLVYRKIRIGLSRYDDDAEALANEHKREGLREMCDALNLWKSGSKVQLTAGLLNWRNRCRYEGQQFLAQLRAEAQSRPVQLRLFAPSAALRYPDALRGGIMQAAIGNGGGFCFPDILTEVVRARMFSVCSQ